MMLIGLSGYIGAGKDLVGNIIQYLHDRKVNGYNNPHSEEELNEYIRNNHHLKSEVKIKKFAGKLKQIASILTGIPVEKFEDQEFKKTLLGPEWNRFYGELNGEGVLLLPKYGTTDEEWKNYKKEHTKPLSIRLLLQLLGTEAIRDNIHTNAWVNALFADYKFEGCKNNGEACDTPNGNCNSAKCYPNWIITDCRFPNEAQAIKDREGIIVRINREIYSEETGRTDIHSWGTKQDRTGDLYLFRSSLFTKEQSLIKFREEISKDLHPSETSLDDWKFDKVLNNDGSINDLIKKVEEAIGEYL